MATTHGLAGLLLGAVLSFVAPEQAPTLMLAGLAGGLAPDADLYAGHRRTLHFPVYGSVLAVAIVGLALFTSIPAILGLAAFVAAAALHAVTDVLGGGLELRPWQAGSERAVYSHYHGQWLAPRRVIPYDGSPRDLSLALALGLPALVMTQGVLRVGVAGALLVSIGYTLLRKRLASIATMIVGLLPQEVTPYVPDRYCVGGNSQATSASRRR
ncbi:MAG: metal-dependent hydrolase [Halapricum sp.]